MRLSSLFFVYFSRQFSVSNVSGIGTVRWVGTNSTKVVWYTHKHIYTCMRTHTIRKPNCPYKFHKKVEMPEVTQDGCVPTLHHCVWFEYYGQCSVWSVFNLPEIMNKSWVSRESSIGNKHRLLLDKKIPLYKAVWMPLWETALESHYSEDQTRSWHRTSVIEHCNGG